MQTILGRACLDHSKPYLTVDQVTIRRAFELHWHSDISSVGWIHLRAEIGRSAMTVSIVSLIKARKRGLRLTLKRVGKSLSPLKGGHVM